MEKETTDKKVVVNVAEGVTAAEITVRHGKALDPKEPRIINIAGVLDTPLQWLKQRKETLDQKQCNIVVNREKMTIALTVQEREHYNAMLVGSLELHPNFEKFGINDGDYMTNFEMAQLFKMNRTHFENQTEAMKLVTELQNFKAKVDREIEKADNTRGDRKVLIAQTVQSNLPEEFNMCLPIFKGMDKQTFEVEVYVRPDDLCCTLVSPAANDIIETSRDNMIDNILAGIRGICPDIVIIEQ